MSFDIAVLFFELFDSRFEHVNFFVERGKHCSAVNHGDNSLCKLNVFATCPRTDQIFVNNNIRIDVINAHIFCVAEQVIMNNHFSSANQMRNRSHQPRTVTDYSLYQFLIRETFFQKFASRRQFIYIFGVAESVRHHSGRNYNRRIFFQVDALKTFIALEKSAFLMSLESQFVVTPKSRQKMYFQADIFKAP